MKYRVSLLLRIVSETDRGEGGDGGGGEGGRGERASVVLPSSHPCRLCFRKLRMDVSRILFYETIIRRVALYVYPSTCIHVCTYT